MEFYEVIKKGKPAGNGQTKRLILKPSSELLMRDLPHLRTTICGSGSLSYFMSKQRKRIVCNSQGHGQRSTG